MRCILALTLVVLLGTAAARAQSPDTLYTFAGTGNVQNWVAVADANPNPATVSNTIPGQLTITELGLHDPDNGIHIDGGPIYIHEGYNRIRESSPNTSGGLDATGLSTIEMDISHNGSGNINAQFYLALGYNANIYYTAGIPDYTLAPNTAYTLQMPLSGLTDAQRAYIRGFGVQTRDHVAIGNVTWTVSEARVLGTPLTVRDLATHNVGSSDNGLNGAFINFDVSSVLGGDGGQNQIGLSQNTSGSGSLQWTDRGTNSLSTAAGAAISWINGTEFFQENSFFERPTDLSNYNRVTYRMSATDVTPGGGGSIGVQHFFQTASATVDYNYQVAGVSQLPVDGQFYDLVIPINAVADLRNVQTMGVNLFAHPNDVIINVDNIRYELVNVPGDYNGNGLVDAADYVLWRKGGPLQNEVDTPGTVNAADYTAWRARFGNSTAASGLGDAGMSVPEPSITVLMLFAISGGGLVVRRHVV